MRGAPSAMSRMNSSLSLSSLTSDCVHYYVDLRANTCSSRWLTCTRAATRE
jgi:hypothetical protein